MVSLLTVTTWISWIVGGHFDRVVTPLSHKVITTQNYVLLNYSQSVDIKALKIHKV